MAFVSMQDGSGWSLKEVPPPIAKYISPLCLVFCIDASENDFLQIKKNILKKPIERIFLSCYFVCTEQARR